MRAIMLLCLASFSLISVSAQKRLDSYTAGNGITYHEGDTIKVGRGSMPDGNFKYFQLGGFNALLTHNRPNTASMPKSNSGYNLIIKKIRQSNANGAARVEFTVGGSGAPTNFMVYVEDAIAVCEIVPCADKTTSAGASQEDQYDKLKKLKALLDSGAITQQEYDEQKKKLLGQQ